MAEKRVIAAEKQTGLKSINNLILVGIMMAVGVVLRLCASFLVLGNMHPNFLIATYCLSILIIRPNVKEAAIIGFISGCISQIGTSMAWIGLISETVGGCSHLPAGYDSDAEVHQGAGNHVPYHTDLRLCLCGAGSSDLR